LNPFEARARWRQGFLLSADELLFEEITDDQRKWLSDFITRLKNFQVIWDN
jgi:hypothetical protein